MHAKVPLGRPPWVSHQPGDKSNHWCPFQLAMSLYAQFRSHRFRTSYKKETVNIQKKESNRSLKMTRLGINQSEKEGIEALLLFDQLSSHISILRVIMR